MAINKICFNRLTIGNIPSSYWESLTYEEQVLWLQKRLNDDIIPAINEMTSFIENYDSQVDELQYQIDIINSYIAGFDRKIEQANQQTIDQLENELTIVENELRDMIISNYNVLKDYVDERDAYLEDKINNISKTLSLFIFKFHKNLTKIEFFQQIININSINKYVNINVERND